MINRFSNSWCLLTLLNTYPPSNDIMMFKPKINDHKIPQEVFRLHNMRYFASEYSWAGGVNNYPTTGCVRFLLSEEYNAGMTIYYTTCYGYKPRLALFPNSTGFTKSGPRVSYVASRNVPSWAPASRVVTTLTD